MTEKQDKARAYRLMRTYGITMEEYDAIKQVQGGKCAICRRAKGISAPLQVDHNHFREVEGKPTPASIRGLLCGRCNNRLGWYEAKETIINQYLCYPPAQEVIG